MSAAEVPAEIVTDWRGELVALNPAILASSDRRRRRLRDRSRRGDSLRHVFEQSAHGELGGEEAASHLRNFEGVVGGRWLGQVAQARADCRVGNCGR